MCNLSSNESEFLGLNWNLIYLMVFSRGFLLDL